MEAGQGLFGQRVAALHQRAQGGKAVGHVAGVLEALVGFAGPHGVTALCGGQAQHVQGHACQRTAPAGDWVGRVGAGVLVGLESGQPVVVQGLRQLQAHGLAHRVDALRVHHGQLFGDVGFGRQRQHQFLEGGVQLGVAQHAAHGVQVGVVQRGGAIGGIQRAQGPLQCQPLARFPAVERVGVVGQQQQPLRIGQLYLQQHRRAEATQQGGCGLAGNAFEHKALTGLGQYQRARGGQFFSGGAQQRGRHRNHEGLLHRLAGGGRTALCQRERVGLGGGVVLPAGLYPRGACLAVPALELGQQPGQVAVRVGVGNGLGKVVAGHGLPVVALEVQLHATGKAVAARNAFRWRGGQGLHHADDFGAFFVNGDGVEIVDFHIAVGAHRVGHGAGVFRELGGAQHAHVFNAFHSAGRGAARHVHAEFLVAEHRQAFFQAELEPVAAGNAVARPVVEVLVPHHRLDVGKVGVGGGGRVGQHVLGVEDVEAFVLHGPHVEVAGGHNHEALQVQRQAKAGFVPGHAGHEGVHGVFGLVQVARAHVHLQQVFGAAARDNALLALHQQARHQRKQVAGLFVRVHPLGKVAALVARAAQGAAVHQVAVAQ